MTKFKPDNHIVGKVYDLTQENMQAMLIYIDKLEEDQEMFLNEHDENVRLHFENVDLKEQNARLRKAVQLALELEQTGLVDFTKYQLTHNKDIERVYISALEDEQ